MVSCVECGREVSSLASSCVSCGAPLSATLESAASPAEPNAAETSGPGGTKMNGPAPTPDPNSHWGYITFIPVIFVLATAHIWLGPILFGTDADDVCDAIFAERLEDPSLQGGHRMLVLDDKKLCVQRMTLLEEESPELFKRFARCVVSADNEQERMRCG